MPADTARLRALKAKATPTPWRADVYGHLLALGSTTNVASTWTTPDENYPDGRPWKENSELIAEAVNSLPDLLDRVERAEAALREVAQSFRCNHPPDDGGDRCDGEDCLRCMALAALNPPEERKGVCDRYPVCVHRQAGKPCPPEEAPRG